MPEHTRRTFLEGLAGAFALGSVGSASGHPSGGSHAIHLHDVTKHAELVGFHSLGSKGSETVCGPQNDRCDVDPGRSSSSSMLPSCLNRRASSVR